MFLDRRTSLTTACLMIATLAQVIGEETRKSRSINDHVTLRTTRLNSLYIEDRDYDNRNDGSDSSIEGNYRERTNFSFSNSGVIVPSDVDDSREFHDEEEKLFAVIMSKDYRVSTPSEIEKFDRIGEQMIARANITEEAKRVVRQVKRQRPGVFWTLARVAFETINETRSAIEQISILVQDNFIPETTTSRGVTSSSLNNSTTSEPVTESSEKNSTISTTTTTTEEPPVKLTPSELQSLVRRNLRGLIRLFNIEWRDAVNESQRNVREFQRDLGNRISPFLQDNPNVV